MAIFCSATDAEAETPLTTAKQKGVDRSHYLHAYLHSFASERNHAENSQRQKRDDGSGGTTDETPVTLPGGITVPTLPDDVTIPTLPTDLTVPSLPGTLPTVPTVTLPSTLPGGVTLPPNITLPTIPATLPDGATIPPNTTLPSLPNITIPSTILPPNTTFPTLPGGITVPTGILENVTLPPDFTFPPLDNITLPPLENVTLPPLENVTFPFNFTLPPFENITLPPPFDNFTFENFTFPPNFTLPPPFENFTLPPNFTLPNVTFPTALPTLPSLPTDIGDLLSSLPTGIANLVSNLISGNMPNLDSLITNTLMTGVSSECSEEWNRQFNTTDSAGISNGVKAVDAFGKIGPGYLLGNVFALGNYDECFSLPDTMYCLADVKIALNSDDFPDPEFLYAVCWPEACNTDDIVRSINSTNEELSLFNIEIEIGGISCEDENKTSYNAGAVIMIVIWCLIGACVLGFSIFHIVLNTIKCTQTSNCKEDVEVPSADSNSIDEARDVKSTVSKIALAFSLCKSIPSLLSTDHKSKTKAITSLNGIMVISMGWIILGHTHLWSYFFDSNSSYVMNNVMPRFSYQTILSSPFGYDSLFLLSGVLVAYVALPKLMTRTKRQYATLVTHFLRRILHFAPVYAIILFSYWLLTVHLADGPIWRQTIGVESAQYENCEKNWWTNLFYINNLYPWANIDECMPWTWYISTEIQFFVFAPIIILPLSFFYPIGLIIAGVVLVANLVVLGGVTGGYELSGSIFLDFDTSPRADPVVPDGRNAIDDLHIKPWTRVGPFVVGIILGFIFFKKFKVSFKKPLINILIYVGLWQLAFVLCYTTVYGLHGAYDVGENLTEGEEVVYQMFSRFSWSLGLAIFLYICHNGYGGVVNTFLSMKLWIPLRRLTLIAYLVHPVILFLIFYTRRVPVYHTDITLAVYAVAAVVLSYGAAAIIKSFVDYPLANLETVVLKMVGLVEEKKVEKEEEEELEMDATEGTTHENYYVTSIQKKEEEEVEKTMLSET